MRRWGSMALAISFAAAALVGGPVTAAQSDVKADCVLAHPCFASTAVGKMAYIEYAPSGTRAGTPRTPAATVILLHGYTDSKRSWSRAARQLHAQDPSLRIIAIDQRGHGQSFRPRSDQCRKNPAPCFSPKVMADDLAAFMDAMGIGSAYIAGHSMGSVVTQYFAKRHPDRTDGAILVATAADVRGNPVLDSWLLKDTILGQWKPTVAAQGYAWPYDTITLNILDADPHGRAWLRDTWEADPIAPRWFTSAIARDATAVRLQTWLGAAEALGSVDNVKGLSRTTTPILALWGTQDAFFHKSDQKAVISSLKTAAKAGGSFCWKQYGVLPLSSDGEQTDDLGHPLQWEAPKQVAQDIVSFIATGKPTPDLYHSGAPDEVHRIVTEKGAAKVICG